MSAGHAHQSGTGRRFTARDFLRLYREYGFRPRMALTILVLTGLAAIFEFAGLAMLLPVVQFIQAGQDVTALTAESEVWRRLVAAFGFLGLPVTLPVLVASVFVLITLRPTFNYLRTVYVLTLGERLIRGLRIEGFARYLRASADYYERVPIGKLINTLAVETRGAVLTLLGPFHLIAYLLTSAASVGVMLLLSPLMTVAIIAVLGLTSWLLKGLMRKTHETSRKVETANSRMGTFLVQRMKSPRLVRLAGTEIAEREAVERLAEAQRKTMVWSSKLLARTDAIAEPVVLALGCLFLYVAVAFLGLGLERLGLFLLIVLRLLPVFKAIVHQRQSMLATLGSLEAVDRRLSEMAAAEEPGGGNRIFAQLHEGIRLTGVVFHYPNRPVPTLQSLDLEIPAGTMTALVGPSGAGKSTLIDLLPRLRSPQKGEIFFDGTPIGAFRTESLRRAIAYAPQNPQVFDVTVAEHIRYGAPEAGDEEIRAAAKLSGADEFIQDLPQGYETQLGEDGVRLSAGQRQRLDLARALVRRAPILVLDEPTSHLDAFSERAFREAVARIRRETDITLIVVGHRLATIADADQIVVLQDGRVSDIGTHDRLMQNGGWYAAAFREQQAPSGAQQPAATPEATATHEAL